MKHTFLFLNFIALLILANCHPTIDSRGFNPETLHIEQIKTGIDNQESIKEKFGSPSTISTFPNDYQGQNWYYISKKTSTVSFHKPETLEQQTVIISFDNSHIVRNVKKIMGELDIKVNEKKTETTGYESNVFRDIFGNFGRYSTKKPR